MYLYAVITPDCHPHDYVRSLRPRRIDGRGWDLIGDKCVSKVLRILRMSFA